MNGDQRDVVTNAGVLHRLKAGPHLFPKTATKSPVSVYKVAVFGNKYGQALTPADSTCVPRSSFEVALKTIGGRRKYCDDELTALMTSHSISSSNNSDKADDDEGRRTGMSRHASS